MVYPLSIEGRRLTLREFAAEDRAAVKAWTDDAEVVRNVPIDPTDSEGIDAYLAQIEADAHARPRWSYTMAVTLRASLAERSAALVPGEVGGAAIGTVGLTVESERHRRAELGYVLRQDDWGSGYATEAAGLMVDFGFEHLGLQRITAQTTVDNAPSQRVLDKLGMQREGRLRDGLFIAGAWRDAWLYALVRGDWTSSARYL